MTHQETPAGIVKWIFEIRDLLRDLGIVGYLTAVMWTADCDMGFIGVTLFISTYHLICLHFSLML